MLDPDCTHTPTMSRASQPPAQTRSIPMRRITPKAVRQDADRRRRHRLAARAERTAAPERPFFGHGPRYLIHPSVAVACGPVLLEIARDLRDAAVPIEREALDRLATFLGGPDSRLFEPSPEGAL